MSITDSDVLHIANLARLELKEGEVKKFAVELNSILGYIHKLEELDVTGIEPTSHVLELSSVMREDVAKPSLGTDNALGNAPDAEQGHYKVPRVIEG
ncbi:Asp-tRNA(Asn)/Glu-tRNA(Gln) amidotransferase subunit GatC [Limisalsivibrio acetivorans]|uniref:Asp-tRNA(Asn)/Glu-tRNA(Gln) amidotransferase subunit GatC n=1 Tax=Limisalsivibrio acetivorans TaxID=1304888 RepID=UPI0003B664C2|nr:Asp-tRNA(Asn)/Glu-tRNA(Gln) amidotransferase subunit GatC [Limisalsivibrio acetivorans]